MPVFDPFVLHDDATVRPIMNDATLALGSASGGTGRIKATTHATQGLLYFGTANDGMVWKDSSKRLGVGTDSPNAPVHVLYASPMCAIFEGSGTASVVHLQVQNSLVNQARVSFGTAATYSNNSTDIAAVAALIASTSPLKSSLSLLSNVGDSMVAMLTMYPTSEIRIYADFLPETTLSYDLGSSSKTWNALYVDSVTLGSDFPFDLTAKILQGSANASSIARQIGEDLDESSVATNGVYGALTSSSSTFSGWGFELYEAPQTFDRVKFYLYAFDIANLPTECVVEIRGPDIDTVIAQATVTLSKGIDYWKAAKLVTADFDRPIANDPAAAKLYLVYYTNGRVAYVGSTSGADVERYYSTDKSVSAFNYFTGSNAKSVYCEFYLTTVSTQRVKQRDEVKVQLAETIAQQICDAEESIPSLYYGVSGHEVRLEFFNAMHLPLFGETYHKVTCSFGTQLSSSWYYSPTDPDAGTASLQLQTLLGQTELLDKTTTLTLAAAAAGTGVTRKVLYMGDSLVYDGTMLAELQNLFDGDAMSITLVGTVSRSGTDADGDVRTSDCEGWSGKTFAWFASDSACPMVYSGVFNFAQYLTDNGISLASGDWVFIQLGANDMYGETTDALMWTQLGTIVTDLATMVASIQSAVSGIRIGFVLVQPGPTQQEAFGLTYNSPVGTPGWRFHRSMVHLNKMLVRLYDGQTASNLYIAPLGLMVDTLHNWQVIEEAVNARNTTTYLRQFAGVHPGAPGYYQMADGAYAIIKNVG